MTTHNTVNPVGSTDVRDLYDNAQNLDSLVNGPLTSYANRLGAQRKSWRGIEQDFAAFLAASGFELPALEYVGGTPLVVDRPTQLIFRTGFPDTLYGVKSTEPFPATLSGTWATDESRLVVRSDGDLRQDIANSTDLAKGAGLVGWKRTPLASATQTVAGILSAKPVSVWEFAQLVTSKPTPADPSTWDWSPAVAAAFVYLGDAGVLEFTEGTFRVSGISTSKTISMVGRGAGVTKLVNATAGATMFTYTQVGMSDTERRNWLTIDGLTIQDDASCTGTGVKTNGVLSIHLRNCYIRDFKSGYGLQCLEALWVYLDLINSDQCELHFKSTATPHNNNVLAIRGGEIRNPPAGKHGLYVENGDIVRLADSTVEGIGGGAMVAGSKFKSVKMLSLENTYFEVLSTATEGGLVLEGCQAVHVGRSQIGSQSTAVPSVLVADCDAVKFEGCVMVAFPVRATGYSSLTIDGCLIEGPMDIAATCTHKVLSPMPYNTRSVIAVNPKYQPKVAGVPRAFANSYADSAFESAAPGVTIVAGAPVSSHDTTQGYYGGKSWRVTGVAGDTIRSATLGVTTAAGQSGCMSFMAKADTAGRFTLTGFLGGAAGSVNVYLSTEWRRYFFITNLRPASVVGDSFLLQLAFHGTNAFNITDVQFVPFTDYGEIPGIVDGFNYIPTRGAAQAVAIRKEVSPGVQYFDRGANIRLPTYADNTAATAGGLAVNDLYKTSTGVVMIRF